MSLPGPVALVINPVATKAGAAHRTEVTRVLAPLGLEWSLTTAGPGDAGRLARQAADEGAAVVVTLGGDGTAAEAAGALADGSVVLAPMPGGNANVFARALGWPARPARALPVLAEALRRGAVREAVLGRVAVDGGEPRVFAINAGVGIDAATVEWIEARPRTKRRLRHAGFALGAVAATLRAGREPHLWTSADGAPSFEAAAVLVACGSPYTYLGPRPLDLVPGATFEGPLAWVALARVRPTEVGGLLARALTGRELPLDGPALRGGRISVDLVVRCERPAPVQADGEVLGRHHELRASRGPTLRVLDPRPAPALKTTSGAPT
jgi:diacylglycerol kinase family enzyme